VRKMMIGPIADKLGILRPGATTPAAPEPTPFEPLPCPFCGKPGRIDRKEDGPELFIAYCSASNDSVCPVDPCAGPFDTYEETLAAWNKRAK
jgi:hypothetical protein